MSRPWELCRVCSLISRISFRSRSEAGKIKFFLTSRSRRGLRRPALYIGPGASWGQARSLLDLRFREFRNETISKAITRTRLESVKRLLSDTGLSIRAISAKCGFANPNHLKNLFKRHFGKSMREWRTNIRQDCAFHEGASLSQVLTNGRRAPHTDLRTALH